jgi:hypothetical protein
MTEFFQGWISGALLIGLIWLAWTGFDIYQRRR